MRTSLLSILALLGLTAPAILVAGPITIDFEGLPDGTMLTNQYPGVTFSNAIILTAGISLNEFEFPPRSGTNVASDNGGPMSIIFPSPIQSFSGYFTYAEPLTLDAFGMGNALLTSVTSAFSSNEALSGVPGSSPNEFLQLTSASGISRVTITGDRVGGSFVVDDVRAAPAAVPEPSTPAMIAVAAALWPLVSRRRFRPGVRHSRLIGFFLWVALGLCFASRAAAAPALAPVGVTPTVLGINTATAVTITVPITDPSLIPGSVNLLRLNPLGNATILGSLKDDGTGGDVVAGDHIYTGQTTFNEASSGKITLQISAAFRGVLQRVKSAPVQITVESGPVSSFTLFVNANDSLLLQGTALTGEIVQYLGTKNATGLATRVTGFTVRDSSNSLTRYTLDLSGRPTQILAPNNALFKLVWNSDGTVSVTGVAPDGSVQTTVKIPVSGATAVRRGASVMPRNVLRMAQEENEQATSSAYLEVDVSKCGLGVRGASVWITVAHALTAAFDDVIRGTDVGSGSYLVPMPTPDPNAGQNAAEKCSTAVGAIGSACDVLQSNPLLPVAVCGGLAASGLPISPAVLTACGAAFAGLELYCATLGAGPSEALDQFICPRIGALVDEYVTRPVDLSLTVNGQPSGSRFGVSLLGPFAPFSVALTCNPVRLNVSKSGAGSGTVTGTPSVINCGGICSDSFLPPSLVQLTATAVSNSTFTAWAGECAGGEKSVSVPISVDTAASISCSANFDLAPQQPVTVTKLGNGQGAVTSVPAGINCGPVCSGSFALRSQISLTAVPFTGSTFSGWGGDCTGTDATITITVDAPKNCTATFSGQLPMVRLNPFGINTTAGPYNVEVVDGTLALTPAPQDITVTLLREVISQCSGLLFSSNRTVVVSQGQTSVSYNFNAGHDPACFSLPITTRYTVTQAVLGASTVLDLSGVPAQQLVLSVFR